MILLNSKNTKHGRLKTISSFAVLLLAFLLIGLAAHNQRAAAIAMFGNPPPSTVLPQNIQTTLQHCVDINGNYPDGHYTPGFDNWISAPGASKVTTVNVNYGQPSVKLGFNYAGVVCSNDSGSEEARAQVLGGSANIGTVSNFSTNSIDVVFGFYAKTQGYFAMGTPQSTFTYSVPGGFTKSGLYTITVISKTINQFIGGSQLCVVPHGQLQATSGWNFKPCPESGASYSIQINVVNPNHPPSGTINTANCTSFSATFSDKDGPYGITDAMVSVGFNPPIVTWDLGNINSREEPAGVPSTQIAYNGYFNPSTLTNATNSPDWAAKQYTLWVRDALPGQPESAWPWKAIATSAPVGPCATLACGSGYTNPGTPEINQPFDVHATVTYSAFIPPPNPVSDKLWITGGPSPKNIPAKYSVDGPLGGGGTMYLDSLPPPTTLGNAGTYNINWSVNFGAGSKSITCPITLNPFTVANKPYMQVYGGDVTAGGGVPDVTGSCGVNTSAEIIGWNKESDATHPWSGAGGQYAVRAMLGITDFASGLGGTPGVATPVTLSFANVAPGHPTAQASGNYGGYFGQALGCNNSDITSIKNPNTTMSTIGPGTTTVTTSTASIVVHGNIVIKGNVIYSGNGTWSGVDQIPNFKVVADGGNIYIDPSVTELDGNYYALPNADGTGGLISTCANGSGHEFTDSSNFSVCNKQLVVNGSLKAGQIHFLRSCGSLTLAGSDSLQTTGGGSLPGCSATNHAAEIINAGPDSWINSGGGGGQGTDQSISSLPPVL